MKTKLTGTTMISDEAKQLKPDGEVTLELEDNKYDDRAVSVKFGGIHIGYLPRDSEVQEAVYEDLMCKRRVEAQIEEYAYFDKKAGFNNKDIGVLQHITINIQMHLGYEKDGESYSSITRLLSTGVFGDKSRLEEWMCSWGSYQAYREALNKTAVNGTNKHKLAEECLISYRDNEPIPDYPCMKNFIEKYKPEIIGIEAVIFDPKLGVAGTYDALLKIKGRLILVDWKTSKSVQFKHKLQIAFHVKNLEADEGWVVRLDSGTKQGFSVTKVMKEDCEDMYKVVEHLSDIQKLLPVAYKLK